MAQRRRGRALSACRRAREPARCAFEHVYFARPDSIVFGDPVARVRQEMGAQLAREAPADADVVVPVPDSGVYGALGYSRESGLPYDMGSSATTTSAAPSSSRSSRSATSGCKVKLNPVRERDQGPASVVLIDDSIVRGTTSRKIVRMVRDAGAAEVHLRISVAAHALALLLRHRHADARGADRLQPRPRGDPALRRGRLAWPTCRSTACCAASPATRDELLHRLLDRRVPGGRWPSRRAARPSCSRSGWTARSERGGVGLPQRRRRHRGAGSSAGLDQAAGALHLRPRGAGRRRPLRRPLPAADRGHARAGAGGLGRRRRHQADRRQAGRRLLDGRPRPGQPLRQRHPGARARGRSSSSTTSAAGVLETGSDGRRWSRGVRDGCRENGCALLGGETRRDARLLPARRLRAGGLHRRHGRPPADPRRQPGARRATSWSVCPRPGCTPTATRWRGGSCSIATGLASGRPCCPGTDLRVGRGAAGAAPLLPARARAAPRPSRPARAGAHHRRRAHRQPAARPARRAPTAGSGSGAGRRRRSSERCSELGAVALDEMLRVFNMGIGMVVVVDPAALDEVLETPASMRAGAPVGDRHGRVRGRRHRLR